MTSPKTYTTSHGNIRYLECIDCGEEKKTKRTQASPKCKSCSAKDRWGNSQYNTKEGFRTCNKCGEEKELTKENFYRKTTCGIMDSTCKVCRLEEKKEYHKANREYILEQRRKEYADPEKRAKKLARDRAYSKRPEAAAKRQKRRNHRKKIDPVYKLRHNISSHICGALKRNKGSKIGESILAHLPYTIAELRQHIESQFEAGMSWENWGKGEGCWNIDHIYPHSKLPYDSLEHPNFAKAWALSNLRPLWEIENIRKRDKIISPAP